MSSINQITHYRWKVDAMKQILCFGDSNTYGLIPGTTGRYDWDTRWTGILGNALSEKGYRIIEEGLCGRTTIFDDPLRSGRRGTELLPVILESHKPIDVVVLMLGTNDCKTFYEASAEVIGLGIKKLINQIKSIQPDAEILLLSPIHLGDDIWDGYDIEFNESSVETSKRLKSVYGNLAEKENIQFIAASDYAAPSKEDREHLNPEGHKAIAEAILKKLEITY